MRITATILAILAAVTFVVASGAINFEFWSQQGRSVHEGRILGVVSIAGDVLKCVLPVLIAVAVEARRWLYVTVGSFALAVFLAAGLVAAVGFSAVNRGDLVGGREGMSSQLDLARRELQAIEGRISRLPGYPPTSDLAARVDALTANPRYALSRQCSDVTARDSQALCTDLGAARAALGGSIEAGRLASQRDATLQEIRRLTAAGAGREADPQAGLLARWKPGLDVATARDGLVLFFGVLEELGASLGLYLATRHSPLATPQVRRSPVILETTVQVSAPMLVEQMQPMRLKAPHAQRFVMDDDARAWAGKRS